MHGLLRRLRDCPSQRYGLRSHGGCRQGVIVKPQSVGVATKVLCPTVRIADTIIRFADRIAFIHRAEMPDRIAGAIAADKPCWTNAPRWRLLWGL